MVVVVVVVVVIGIGMRVTAVAGWLPRLGCLQGLLFASRVGCRYGVVMGGRPHADRIPDG